MAAETSSILEGEKTRERKRTAARNARGLRACLLGGQLHRVVRAAGILRAIGGAGNFSARRIAFVDAADRHADGCIWFCGLVPADFGRKPGRPIRISPIAGVRLPD